MGFRETPRKKARKAGLQTYRGWLCDPCNVVLGLVKDNPELLEKLAEHLRKPEIGSFVNLLKIQSNGLRKG